MKIRAYLALTIIAVLVPVVIFSAVALNMLLHAERKAVLKAVHESARATALIVDRELFAAEAALRALATSNHLVSGDLQRFYEQAVASGNREDSWTVLFDLEGRQLVNTRSPFGSALPRRRNPGRGLEIMQMQKPYVSNLIHGSIANLPVISIETPVPGVDNGRRYVLSRAFLATHFNRAFGRPGTPSDWVISIIDREGTIIARNRSASDFVGKPVMPELMQAARSAKEGVIRLRSLDGIDVYGVFTHSEMSGWTIGIGVPVESIDRSARRAVTVAAFGLLAAIACAITVAILLGRRFTMPIAGAAQSAAALGHGEIPVFARSGVTEVDALHAALSDAGMLLKLERDSRMQIEMERARLFESEKEARKLAEAQNKAKDEFLAMLGHELRNPLSALANAVSLMQIKGLDQEKTRRALGIMKRQSEHLSHIVDDLLDMSRVMSGKILLDRRRIDLAEMTRNCVDTLAATGRADQQTIHVRTELAWVDADPTRLEQIISNLLVNASKYTPAGGKIEVEVHVAASEAVLTVRDSGIGISAQLLPHIFDVFVQGPAELDRAHGGLGIGLALVQRLVALHGGTVTAESAGSGLGSTFIVRLPCVPAPANENLPPALAIEDVSTCRVLLIEDNADSRQTLSAVLSLNGFQVEEASDGEQGLRMALALQPDVAVIDIGLPITDGYELARRIRAEARGVPIGLIALTGYGQAEDRQRALDAGFNIHLTKPAESRQVIESIIKAGALAHENARLSGKEFLRSQT